MKVSMIILIALTIAAWMGIVQGARQAEEELLLASLGHSPTGRLLKRSLCNTFGGCGAKRSMQPLVGGYKAPVDESSEERRYESEDRMIKEILDGIIEHLQRDQNYKQGRYTMYLPKQTRAAAGHRQQHNNFNQNDEPDRNRQHSIQANEFEELRLN